MATDYNYNPAQMRYPSPAEVKIYLGRYWVDDAYRVDYTVSTPRTPLYDYTSKFYKDVAEGHTIVQGQLVINYRFPNYLLHAIRGNLEQDPNVAKTMRESSDMFYDLAQGTAKEKVFKLLEMKRLGVLKPAKQAAATLYGGSLTFAPDRTLDAADTSAPVASQKDIMQFDISIKYGGEESTYDHTLRDCVLVGESQVISAAALAGGDLSASSMPIYEIYSFFAKKVDTNVTEQGLAYLTRGPLNIDPGSEAEINGIIKQNI